MNTENWQLFNINIFFIIQNGNKFDKNKMSESSYSDIAFVSRTSKNNGICCFVDSVENIKPYSKGNLTIALGGSLGETFLQPMDFYTSQNVAVLIPKKEMSTYVKFFLSRIIKKEAQTRYAPFARELNKYIKENFFIKLPAIKDKKGKYTPDWQFMEDYVKNTIIPKLPTKVQQVYNNTFDKTPFNINKKFKLDTENWHWFKIGKIFWVDPGKYHYPDEYIEGSTPYISATNVNNGISKYIDLPAEFQGNVLTNDKVKCKVFYQQNNFCATSDINIISTKNKDYKLNKYQWLFIASIIYFNESYRWNYGRQCRNNNTKKITIKLPAIKDKKGEYTPDWQFMEDYIKSLPYSQNL